MENSLTGCAKLLLSVLVFLAIGLAIGGIAYQFFSPEGLLYQWREEMWAAHPLQLLLLGVSCFLVKRWLDGLENSVNVADFMVYLAVLVGLFFGIHLMIVN